MLQHDRFLQFRLLLLVVLSMLLTNCGATNADGVTLTGSTSVTPFAEHLGEIYARAHPGSIINVQGLGSAAGIQAAENGTAEIGMSSRDLEAEEKAQLDQVEIAYDALAVIVNPANPITNLSRSDIQRIFVGSIRSWSELQGQDAPITLISREEGSGTFTAFEDLLMDKQPITIAALRQGSNGAIRQIVAGNPNAIGYISLGIVDSSVKAIAIDGVQPSAEHVLAGKYKLVRPFLFVWRKGHPLSEPAQQFLDYVLSSEGQRELVLGGLIEKKEP